MSKLVALGLAAGLGVWYFLAEDPSATPERPAFEVNRTGSGLQVAWNLDAPELRKPISATLLLRDGLTTRSIPLDERSGTLLLNLESKDISVRARLTREGGMITNVSLLRGNDPVIGLALYQPGQEKPIVLLTDTVQTVEPVTNDDLRRRIGPKAIEIEVFLKVNTQGKISGTSTRYSEDPLIRELSMLATTAAMQWQFEPVTLAGKKVATDGKLSFWFSGKDKRPPFQTD